jgi:hypothetical protein
VLKASHGEHAVICDCLKMQWLACTPNSSANLETACSIAHQQLQHTGASMFVLPTQGCPVAAFRPLLLCCLPMQMGHLFGECKATRSKDLAANPYKCLYIFPHLCVICM